MGCRTSKLNEGVIVIIPTKTATTINKKDENLNLLKGIAECSLREYSLIPVQLETVDPYDVDDLSIVNIIKELQ